MSSLITHLLPRLLDIRGIRPPARRYLRFPAATHELWHLTKDSPDIIISPGKM